MSGANLFTCCIDMTRYDWPDEGLFRIRSEDPKPDNPVGSQPEP